MAIYVHKTYESLHLMSFCFTEILKYFNCTGIGSQQYFINTKCYCKQWNNKYIMQLKWYFCPRDSLNWFPRSSLMWSVLIKVQLNNNVMAYYIIIWPFRIKAVIVWFVFLKQCFKDIRGIGCIFELAYTYYYALWIFSGQIYQQADPNTPKWQTNGEMKEQSYIHLIFWTY